MIYREKYYRLNIDFPNKAGKLSQVLATQKRLVEKLLKSKQDETTTQLIHSVAEGYDVANELMIYMKEMLQSVADDSEALVEGSEIREKLTYQSEALLDYMNREMNYLDHIKEKLNGK